MELRSGRHLESTTMQPGEDTSPPATPVTSTQFITLPQARDPGTFSGANSIDVDEWVSMYERVSKQNGWDPTIMLANVIFYLGRTPRVWFWTCEDDINSWDTFKQQLRDLFATRLVDSLLPRNNWRYMPRRQLNRTCRTYRTCWPCVYKLTRRCPRLTKSSTF